jgi:hypothetical protein
MARITIAQRTIDAKTMKLVTTHDEHKQKIKNKIDM